MAAEVPLSFVYQGHTWHRTDETCVIDDVLRYDYASRCFVGSFSVDEIEENVKNTQQYMLPE